jgi:hypothetical protein
MVAAVLVGVMVGVMVGAMVAAVLVEGILGAGGGVGEGLGEDVDAGVAGTRAVQDLSVPKYAFRVLTAWPALIAAGRYSFLLSFTSQS